MLAALKSRPMPAMVKGHCLNQDHVKQFGRLNMMIALSTRP